jgi:tRNA pseudouridine(38-40) synthase
MSTVTATSPFISDAVQQQRDQFAAYVLARNWKFCESYWSRTIKHSCYALPPFIEGDVVSTYSPTSYGVSNLSVIREAGMKGEFISKNDRYQKRQTFALRIGYDGNQYHGYQKQTYCPGLTVEGDLTVALERNTIGAGRTDRGVSGISQVICFATQDMTVKAEDLISKFKESAPFKEGRLAVYDCQRVPKKFHSRASATWRRYLSLFPLNRIDGANECDGDGGGKLRGVFADAGMDPASAEGAGGCAYDVDIDHLNRILSR